MSTKIGAYVRVTRMDRENLVRQKEAIRKHCLDKFGIEPQLVYEEIGYSGFDFSRPSLDKLLLDISEGKIDVVIVKNISRLGREFINTRLLLRRLTHDLKARVIAIDENIDSNNWHWTKPITSFINDMYENLTNRTSLNKQNSSA